MGAFGAESSRSDISAGTDRPACVQRFAPPRDGVLASNWIAPNTTLGNVTICTLGCALNGTVNTSMLTIDVSMDMTLLQNTTQLAQLIRAVAGATANTVYGASLDGGGVYNQIGEAVATLTGL